MAQLFHLILIQPLLNALVFLYDVIPGNNLAVAIVILTFLIKLLLYPLASSSIKSQKALQELQPKLNELKIRYKNDKEGLAKATMELYKADKVNPLSSCLPLLIQLPFLIAVFQVFRSGLSDDTLNQLYSFVPNPGHLTPSAFGLDLSKPNFILAAVTGAAQFWQTKMMTHKSQPKVAGAKDEDMMAQMNKQMMYFVPITTIVIGAGMPAGLLVYWLTTTLLTIAQQKFIFSRHQAKKEISAESHETRQQ